MNDEMKMGIIANVFRQLEKSLALTGLTLVNYIGEDTLRDDTLHVYDGDKFLGVIKTTIFDDKMQVT